MKRVLILFTLCFSTTLFGSDTTRFFSVSFGSLGYIFNRDLIANSSPMTKFMAWEFNPFKYYAVGIKASLPISKRKHFNPSIYYADGYIGYLYSPSGGFTTSDVVQGRIRMKGAVINTVIQFNLKKWIKLNYGLSHYISHIDRFDRPDIATLVGWYDSSGKSNRNVYSIGLHLGFNLPIYKRLSLDFNYSRGISNFVILELKNRGFRINEQLRITGFTFTYRISEF